MDLLQTVFGCLRCGTKPLDVFLDDDELMCMIKPPTCVTDVIRDVIMPSNRKLSLVRAQSAPSVFAFSPRSPSAAQSYKWQVLCGIFLQQIENEADDSQLPMPLEVVLLGMLARRLHQCETDIKLLEQDICAVSHEISEASTAPVVQTESGCSQRDAAELQGSVDPDDDLTPFGEEARLKSVAEAIMNDRWGGTGQVPEELESAAWSHDIGSLLLMGNLGRMED